MRGRWSSARQSRRTSILSAAVAAVLLLAGLPGRTLAENQRPTVAPSAAAPVPAREPARRVTAAVSPDAASAERRARIAAVKSWGYQLIGLSIDEAARSPYDLIIADATAGLASEQPFTSADVERLKRKPDGGRRIVLSYLSIGESEDYRSEYFSKEYMDENEAPDWLLKENKQWKGNRLVRFCEEGWQRTILGDDQGKSLYSADPSPLYRIVELGFDGVSLDRVDVYSEVTKECPSARAEMVAFVGRLAAHARKANPMFMVVLQNAEELVEEPAMLTAIDAVLKEDLYYGAPTDGHANSRTYIREAVARLRRARAGGRPVLVIEYIKERVRAGEVCKRIEAEGFVAYVGPRKLDRLWMRGINF
jgi:cysteinyl-tRNA synthetase, unknown class